MHRARRAADLIRMRLTFSAEKEVAFKQLFRLLPARCCKSSLVGLERDAWELPLAGSMEVAVCLSARLTLVRAVEQPTFGWALGLEIGSWSLVEEAEGDSRIQRTPAAWTVTVGRE